jgi:long-chain acyl-CoA synthetase
VEKVWLQSYAKGVPAEINPDAYQSIVELFEQSCRHYANLPAFYNLGVTLTYGQLDQYSRDFAAYLQQSLHLKKGDRFAIMLPNSLQYPIAMFGAMRAGLIIVNVNPLYTTKELAYQLNNSGANAIVALSNFAMTVQQALPQTPAIKHVIITELGDMQSPFKAWLTHFVLKYIYKKIPNWSIPHALSFKQVLNSGKNMLFTPVPITNQDIAFLQYTGGTTGVSKGAVLTHRNMIANVMQADAWFKDLVVEKEEIIITALPLYHIFSLMANCIFFMKIGGYNILITNPRDLPHMIKEMKKFKFTTITGVNTLFNGLLKNSAFSKLDFSQLRLALGGGMAVQRAVAEKWQSVTGKPILEAYGLTETSPCVTINPATLKAYNGTIGLPVSSTDVCIMDDNHQPLPIGEPGELAVKGPQVMKGYWQNPSETEKVFTQDGWLLTGDIATLDDKGYVRILERKKDMILISGFNVYPNEIENVIVRIPGVREAAVIGVPDENTGEALKAFIVKDGAALTTEEVVKQCRKDLTPYKVPKQIAFVDELPKSNVGKILRRALREKSS